LIDGRASKKISVINRLLKLYADKLPNAFVVVTEEQVRFAQPF
jgi:hypothetical protein